MTDPPTLYAIDAVLAEMRQPFERQLVQLQDIRDRVIEHHRSTGPVVEEVFIERANSLRRNVRDRQRRVDGFPQSAIRTLVVCNRESEALSAIAVVNHSLETPKLKVGDWTVHCVHCSFHLLRCQVGEVIQQGLVVSVDGSPMLDEQARRKTLDDLRAPPLPWGKERANDRLSRRLKFERFLAERRLREQLWQEQLFQRRRAVEQREALLREKARKQREQIEDERRKQLDTWDRELELRLLGENAGVERSEEAISAAEGQELSTAHEIVDEQIATTASAPDMSQMPTPSEVGLVLAALTGGCAAGFFIQPTFFSLFGAFAAGAASLALRARRAGA